MGFEPTEAIEVKAAAGKGLGVFARRAIRKGEIIEHAPVLVMSAEDYAKGLDKTLLAAYVFNWGTGQIALALGFGSLYNHSYKPNARYEDDETEPRTKRFVAIKAIKEGEEVTVNYNGSPTARAKMWFDVVPEKTTKKKAATPPVGKSRKP